MNTELGVDRLHLYLLISFQMTIFKIVVYKLKDNWILCLDFAIISGTVLLIRLREMSDFEEEGFTKIRNLFTE